MTSPRTTLTRGQYAPLLHRSFAAPHSTLPQPDHAVFLRRDLRLQADYFANRSVAAVSGDGTLAATATGISAALPWQRALNILVIDDSHFSREAIAAALVKVGFAVDTAEDGANGVRRAAEKLFDVALVDFEMPGMKGPEVLRKLRALGAKAPTLLIMLTSRTGAVDRLRAKFAGCDAYMTKPTRMQEFLKILRDFANAGKLSRS